MRVGGDAPPLHEAPIERSVACLHPPLLQEPHAAWTVVSEHIKNDEAIMTDHLHNPKLDEHPTSNAEKDPANWVSGNEPITGAQASYLATLCEEAGVALPIGDLTKADASRQIDEMKAKLGRE
jgi:hypothetical protein